MRILITGGAGFIGSAVIRQYLAETEHQIVNVDKLTYAANLNGLAAAGDHPRYAFEQVDICDAQEIARVFDAHDPGAVMHLAAETHVDRSIDGPAAFIETNVVGTQTLLEAALKHWQAMDDGRRRRFRFHHVSTDEVFGSLDSKGCFTETSPYSPRSPYAASKAAADHLVRAWQATYGLPVTLSNTSNNYGPYQHAEKLIPLMIMKARAGERLPVYGKGENVRDWIYVEDHARALRQILEQGRVSQSYNVGARCERRNIDVIHAICQILDELLPSGSGLYKDQVEYVTDRPGHDFRYAIDPGKIEAELRWRPEESFDSGLRKTVEWYLSQESFGSAAEASYRGERLGLAEHSDNSKREPV